MAFFKASNISIRGVSACVPSQIIENKDLPFYRDGEAEKAIQSTGIERHRIVPENVLASDLCFHAAEKLIADLKWDKSEIDVLIFVGLARDYIVPHTSALLQHRLGLSTECMAFDLPFGCPGYVYGLSVMSKLLTGELKKGLLLVGDTNSTIGSKEDKTHVPLFSDAGTATVVEFDSENNNLSYFHLATDGGGYESIIVPEGGYRNYFTLKSLEVKEIEPGIKRHGINTVMQGMNVMLFAISKAPESLRLILEYSQKDTKDIDYFVLHQANKFINDRIKKKFKINSDKVPSNLKDFGNTGSASVPLLMVTELKKPLKNNELTLVLTAFGAGLSWGSACITTNKIICSDLIEL